MENQINVGNQNALQMEQNISENQKKDSVNIETNTSNKRNIVIIVALLLIFCSTITIFYFVRRNNDYRVLQKTIQQTSSTQNQPSYPSTTNIANIKVFESVPLEQNDAIVYYEFAYDRQGSLWTSNKTGTNRKKLIWSNQ